MDALIAWRAPAALLAAWRRQLPRLPYVVLLLVAQHLVRRLWRAWALRAAQVRARDTRAQLARAVYLRQAGGAEPSLGESPGRELRRTPLVRTLPPAAPARELLPLPSVAIRQAPRSSATGARARIAAATQSHCSALTRPAQG